VQLFSAPVILASCHTLQKMKLPIVKLIITAASVALVLPSHAKGVTPNDIVSAHHSGRAQQALTMIDQYLTTNPRDPDMLLLKGVILAERNNRKEAERIFRRLIDDFPFLPEPYNNLAVLYAQGGQVEKAKVVLEMAIKTNASYATAFENLSNIYARLASESYSKALNIDARKLGLQPKLRLINQVISISPAAPLVAADEKSQSVIAVPEQVATPSRSSTNPPVPESSSDHTKSTQAAAQFETIAPQTEPAPTASVTAALATLEAWRAAWSNKDIHGYIATYTPGYQPSANITHKDWVKDRTARIMGKARIKVRVSDIDVIEQSENQVIISFSQNYESDRFRSVIKKRMTFIPGDRNWMISREQLMR
jgi:hypothetical protein